MKIHHLAFKISSQVDWRTAERARLLSELLEWEHFGTRCKYYVNEGRARRIDSFDRKRVAVRIRTGRIGYVEVLGDDKGRELAPHGMALSITEIWRDEEKGHLIGSHIFAAGWHLDVSERPQIPRDLTPLLAKMESVAGPLELRYGSIRDHGFTEQKREEFHEQWISPQFYPYAERVTLLGGREIERFGREYLCDAPVHEIRELDCGAIVLIASPDSLDAHAPEDEEALDRLYEYLMAHPNAGSFM